MAFRSLVLAALAFSLVAAGCTGSRRSSGPRDSGPRPVDTGPGPGDSSTPPDSSIVLMDSGTTTPECDAARPCPVGQTCNVSGVCVTDTTPECSASRPCPSGQTCNASGMCVTDTPPACDESVLSYITGSYCSATTGACAEGCADGACQQACIDADPNEDCGACINQNSISCVNSARCQRQWDLYVCCLDEVCGPDPSSTCVSSAIDGACSAQVGAWRTCADLADVNAECPNWFADCF